LTGFIGGLDPGQVALLLIMLSLGQDDKRRSKPMSNTPHELAEEFPAETQKMHQMKLENAHFAKIFEEYHEVNRAVHRAETNVEPTDDAHENRLRQDRVRLKDEVWAMLQAQT
jgi:hypothetical protein